MSIYCVFFVVGGPRVALNQKYSKMGLVTPAALLNKGVDPDMANILAGVANFGLSSNTWKTYQCIIKHLGKCEECTGHSMELPFNTSKMLTLVGWMINSRGLKASSISVYISALRMYHLAMGFNAPVLREPIVQLILKGKSNWDMVQRKISGEVGRLPVTNLVLKLIKKNILKMSTVGFPGEEKLLVWASSTILWNGSFRVHEILSRNQMEMDPLTSLLWGDLRTREVKIDNSILTALSFRIKSPKIDRVGTGDFVELYETRLYNCPVKAFNKWRKASSVPEHPELPIFRTAVDVCYTGRKLNERLAQLTVELSSKIKGGKVTSHSFRAGVASEMCKAGYSEQDIQAVGRWATGSAAYKAYCKLPMTHRANLAREIAMG